MRAALAASRRASARRRAYRARRGARRRGRRDCAARSASTAPALLAALPRAQRGAPRQGAHALQRGLARDGRLGHRARADLRRARARASPCTSGSTRRARATRARASPPGSSAQHGVPHTRDRRQRRRPPDAARTASTCASSGADRIDRERRRLQQDRHLPEGARGARQRRAVLRGAALLDDRLDARRRRAIPIEERDAARGARRSGGRAPTARSSRCDVLPRGSPAANPAFDVTPARLVTGARHRARCARPRARACRALSRARQVRRVVVRPG